MQLRQGSASSVTSASDRTAAVWALFDHLVGGSEQRIWNGEADLEAEVVVVLGDVPMAATREEALRSIRLMRRL
jgi:2-keto-4-pentenoate hydratase/2-oxohepta-3-ene-1,7-dioic acid hydratase in catechol pathway